MEWEMERMSVRKMHRYLTTYLELYEMMGQLTKERWVIGINGLIKQNSSTQRARAVRKFMLVPSGWFFSLGHILFCTFFFLVIFKWKLSSFSSKYKFASSKFKYWGIGGISFDWVVAVRILSTSLNINIYRPIVSKIIQKRGRHWHKLILKFYEFS